jgi:hypothetical protein
MNRKIIFYLLLCCTIQFLGCKKTKEQGTPSQQTENIDNNSANENADSKGNQRKLSQGCQLDKKLFDKAEVFEPLASELPENQSPTKVSLEQHAPKRLSQGSQGSCTAWACAYAAATINRVRATSENPNQIAFSPAFVYNQITRGNCEGTHIGTTLEKLTKQGIVPLTDFEYDENDCARQPDRSLVQRAAQFKIKGFNRLTLKHDDYRVDMQAIKQNISQGAPVVIGMAVGGSFYNLVNKPMWKPTRKDYDALQKGMDGHIVDDGSEAGF